jgi:hypothetical protein
VISQWKTIHRDGNPFSAATDFAQTPAEGMECGVTMYFPANFSTKDQNREGINIPFQTNWLCRTFASTSIQPFNTVWKDSNHS